MGQVTPLGMKQKEPSEDGAVEGRVEVVGEGHHGAQVLLHQVGVFPHGLAEAAEDDAHLGELLLVGGGDADAIEDHVHGHARESLLFVDGDAELLEGADQLRVHLVHTLVLGHLGLGGRVVDDLLELRLLVVDVGPGGFRHGQPVAVGLEAELQEPLGLTFLGADEADGVLGQPRRRAIGLDVRHEAVFVFLTGDLIQGRAHGCSQRLSLSNPYQKSQHYKSPRQRTWSDL
jgi:hypothetical protein